MITVNYCSCQLRVWCLLKKQMLFETPVLTVTRNNIKLILDFQKDVKKNSQIQHYGVFPQPAMHDLPPTSVVPPFFTKSKGPTNREIGHLGISSGPKITDSWSPNFAIYTIEIFDENPSSMLGLSHLWNIDLTGHPSYFYQKWPHGGIKSDICNPWLLSFLNHVSIMPWVSVVNFDLCFFFRRYEADPNTINTHPPFTTIRMAQNHFIEDFDVTFSVSWSIRHFIPQVFIS